MAPVSGPLTHGVAGTHPSARATLMSMKRAVACRTFSTSGEDSPVSWASAGPVRSDSAASAQSIDSGDGLDERYMVVSLARIAQLRMTLKVVVRARTGIRW